MRCVSSRDTQQTLERTGIVRLTKNLGTLLLAIWLILTGLAAFVGLGSIAQLLSILAIAAGVLLLLGR